MLLLAAQCVEGARCSHDFQALFRSMMQDLHQNLSQCSCQPNADTIFSSKSSKPVYVAGALAWVVKQTPPSFKHCAFFAAQQPQQLLHVVGTTGGVW